MNVYKYLKQLIVTFLFIMPILEALPFAYVATTNPPGVLKIDVATNTIVPLPSPPSADSGFYDIAVDQNNLVAAVTDYTNNSLYLYRVLFPTGVLPPITNGIGMNPAGVAFVPHQDFSTAFYAVIANAGDQSFSVLQGLTATQYTLAYTGIKRPNFVAIAPDGQTAYITDAGDGSSGSLAVYPIDIRNLNAPVPLAPIPIPNSSAGRLSGIAITSDSQTAYVINVSDTSVYVINNLKTNPTVSPTGINLNTGILFPATNSYQIVLSSDNTTAYVTNSGSPFVGPTITMITGLPTTPTPISYPIAEALSLPLGLAITPDNQHVYIAVEVSPDMTIFNTGSLHTTTLTINRPSTSVGMSLVPNPPTSVQGCSVETLSNLSNIITWSPPQTGALVQHYNIYRGTVSPSNLIAQVSSFPLEYIDINPPLQAQYTYNITSVSLVNIPSPSTATYAESQPASITLTSGDCSILPPSSITGCASPMLNDWVNTISWSPPTSGVNPTAYQIYRDGTLINTVPSNELSYQDSYLTPDIPYTYAVYSLFANVPSYQAATITIYPYDLCHPAMFPPSSIQGCAMQEGNTVTNIITWTPPAYGPMPTEYQIFRDPSLYDLVATVPSYQLSYEDTNLNPSMTYSYYIISVDQYGDVSDPIGITITQSCSPTPSDPTNAIGTIRSNTFLNKTECVFTMTWTPSTSANVASYNIYNGTTLVANIPATSPSTFITLLSKGNNGKNYSITAVNSNGAESDHVPVIIQCPPQKCKGVKKC